MDLNSLIEALRGTMDANLREAAERQLNEVKWSDNDGGGGGGSAPRALRSRMAIAANTVKNVFLKAFLLAYSPSVTHNMSW